MGEAIPPSPNTSSWRGIYLSTGVTTFAIILNYEPYYITVGRA